MIFLSRQTTLGVVPSNLQIFELKQKCVLYIMAPLKSTFANTSQSNNLLDCLSSQRQIISVMGRHWPLLVRFR